MVSDVFNLRPLHPGFASLAEVEAAPPTAELEPITADYVQTDEEDMGMSYEELGAGHPGAPSGGIMPSKKKSSERRIDDSRAHTRGVNNKCHVMQVTLKGVLQKSAFRRVSSAGCTGG